MSLLQETVRSIGAAFRIARGDASGFSRFNVSVEGFRRSFLAAFLLAPLFLIYFDAAVAGTPMAKVADAQRWLIALSGYALMWAGWPLLAFFMARIWDKGDKLHGYIVALNWTQMITYPPLVLVALFGPGMIGAEAASSIGWLLLFAVLFLEGYIALRMLEVPFVRATVLELMLFVYSQTMISLTFFVLSKAAPAAAG